MPFSRDVLDEMAAAQDVFVWETLPREPVQRSRSWYLWMAAIVVAFSIYAVFTANYLFAFIIFLSAAIVIMTGDEAIQPVLIQIGQNGLVVDGKFFLYRDLQDFSIVYQPPETKLLYVQAKSSFQPRLRIFLEDQDPLEIRRHLKQYIKEDLNLQDEHLSDSLARLLRI